MKLALLSDDREVVGAKGRWLLQRSWLYGPDFTEYLLTCSEGMLRCVRSRAPERLGLQL